MGYQAKVKRARRWLVKGEAGRGVNDTPPARDVAVIVRVDQKRHPRKPQKVRAPVSPFDSSTRLSKRRAAEALAAMAALSAAPFSRGGGR